MWRYKAPELISDRNRNVQGVKLFGRGGDWSQKEEHGMEKVEWLDLK